MEAAQGPMLVHAFLVSSFSRSASRVVLACQIDMRAKAEAITEGWQKLGRLIWKINKKKICFIEKKVIDLVELHV